jgi:hypothetical protein
VERANPAKGVVSGLPSLWKSRKISKDVPPLLSRPDIRDKRILVVDERGKNKTRMMPLLQSLLNTPFASLNKIRCLLILVYDKKYKL